MNPVRRGLLPGLGLMVAVLFFAALLVGPAPLGPTELWAALGGGGDEGGRAALILWEIRLPRALLALLVGAALGLSGAALQGLLRNPLAEPGLVGVSGAAAFGAVVTLYTGLAGAFTLALPLGGLAGALIAATGLYLLAGRNAGVLTLILAGVAINSLAGALTAVALNLAPSPYAVTEIIFWTLGSLADRSLDHVALAAPLIGLGCALLLGTGRALDALTLGEETAASLGLPLRRLRRQVIVGVALAVGAAVSVAGVIGFVGLIVPHLLRPLVGYRPGRLLGAGALGGALLLLAADLGVRLAPVTPELKLGVVTALIGAPFFLHLVLYLRRRVA